MTNEFTEVGVAGYKTNISKRTALQQILDGARSGLFDILLVFMFDRIGRRAQETRLLIPILQQLGIRIYSVKEGELKLSDAGELLQYIKFWSAENESRHTTQMRVEARLKQFVSDGEYRGGAIPFGYQLQKDFLGSTRSVLIQSLKEATIVKFIFDSFLQKHSISEIQNKLENNNYYPRKGRSWSRSSIYAILGYVTYTGHIKYGTVYSPFIERLCNILQEQFDQVQNLLKSRASSKENIQERSPIFNVICEDCQVAFKKKSAKKTIHSDKGESITYKKDYYFCSCAHHPKSIKKYHPLNDVNRCIEEKLDELLTIAYSNLDYTIRRFHLMRNRLGVERREANEYIEKLKKQKNDLMVAIVESGKYKDDERFNSILNEIAITEYNSNAISSEINNIKTFLNILKGDKEMASKEILFKVLFLSVGINRTGEVCFEYSTSGRILNDIIYSKKP